MCSRFQSVTDDLTFQKAFGLSLPGRLGYDSVRAGTESVFIKKQADNAIAASDELQLEALFGFFGLSPQFLGIRKFDHQTFNTPFETISKNLGFSEAWSAGHRCVVPATAIYEPDWRSGVVRDTKVSRADGRIMGIAGLWAFLPSPVGAHALCFTMLTVKAENYLPMRNLLAPEEPKRMVVILPEESYSDWLQADVKSAEGFMKLYRPDNLLVEHSKS